MTTTPDNSANTWRDLTNQLNPDQVAYIEYWECHPELPPQADSTPPPPERHRAALLFAAREFAAANVAAIAYADVAPPPDAVDVDTWSDSFGDDSAGSTRFFTGSRRVIGSVNVDISGWQCSDGRVERTIRVYASEQFDDGDMPVEQARAVAAAIVEAADEIEQAAAL